MVPISLETANTKNGEFVDLNYARILDAFICIRKLTCPCMAWMKGIKLVHTKAAKLNLEKTLAPWYRYPA
jgi:hypothetical protein